MNEPLEELACLYVLDRLEPLERVSFEASLRRDPELAGFVSDIESTLELGLRSPPQINLPGGLLERIEARIDRLPGNVPFAHFGAATPFWGRFARWGVAALIAIGIGTLVIRQLERGPSVPGRPYVIVVGLDPRRSTLTELPLQNRAADADARFVQLASLAEEFWEKPQKLPVRLGLTGQSGHGYALFDPASNQGFIAVKQLQPIGHGQRYHLWMLETASGRIREAGVLPTTTENNGLYFFSIVPAPEAKTDRLDFFVTVEDAASESTRPSGRVVLGSQRTF